MKPKKDQITESKSAQSPHDPAKLEACPSCGAPSTVANNERGKPERLHRVSRGNGMYGYDVADHPEGKK